MRKLLKRLFEKKYVYHVVYRIPNGNGTIFITRNKKIKTIEDVNGIREYIKNECGFEALSIEGWTRLSA